LSWLDVKYVNLLCPSFRNFKRKSDTLFVMSCPICGDSEKNRFKARGYVFEKGDSYRFFCHNCGASKPFHTFLSENDPVLYRQYMFEKFGDSSNKKIWEKNQPAVIIKSADTLEKYFRPVSELPDTHKARKYLIDRKLSVENINRFYYTNNLNLSKKIFGDEYLDRNLGTEERVVLPVRNEDGKLTGLVCRAIGKGQRYVNLKADHNISEQIFNIEKVNMTQRIDVVEGPIDCLCLDNAIAVIGADFTKAIPHINLDRDNFILDNQPRNRTIVDKMWALAEKGCRVMIWPDNLPGKDINDLVIKGVDPRPIIKNNIYQGLILKLKLAKWSKC